jgi:hypothetical protein
VTAWPATAQARAASTTERNRQKEMATMLKKLTTLFLVTVAASPAASSADPVKPRQEVSVDGSGWRVWLDEEAEWQNDKLYAPGEVPALDKLPVNPPTGGWEVLVDKTGKACAIPASVEEYFSGGSNIWTYHGVSWFWRDVEIPAAWKGKVVRLQVEKARMRAEIYINGKLAGYDLVAETPFDVDLSAFLRYGERNRIAFRLTNPGGQRGWTQRNQLPPPHRRAADVSICRRTWPVPVRGTGRLSFGDCRWHSGCQVHGGEMPPDGLAGSQPSELDHLQPLQRG